MLSKAQLLRVARMTRSAKEQESQNFLRHMRQNSGKTDDQLLLEFQQILDQQQKGKIGRPGGAEEQRTLDKVYMAWRLSQRGQTWDQIAKLMEVAPTQVGTYLRRAREMLKVDPHQINLPQQIGETLDFYDDVRQMALMHASMGNNVNTKLSAMSIALTAQGSKNDFLTKVGVYSPSVVDSFRQLVLQQVTVLMGTKEKEKPPVDNVELFFANLAQQLLECATVQPQPLQSIAHQGHIIEGVSATPG